MWRPLREVRTTCPPAWTFQAYVTDSGSSLEGNGARPNGHRIAFVVDSTPALACDPGRRKRLAQCVDTAINNRASVNFQHLLRPFVVWTTTDACSSLTVSESPPLPLNVKPPARKRLSCPRSIVNESMLPWGRHSRKSGRAFREQTCKLVLAVDKERGAGTVQRQMQIVMRQGGDRP